MKKSVLKRIQREKTEMLGKEAKDTKEAFGHDIPRNIEIEPFAYPYTSEKNARLIRSIKKKRVK
jgi:hypothetical protein